VHFQSRLHPFIYGRRYYFSKLADQKICLSSEKVALSAGMSSGNFFLANSILGLSLRKASGIQTGTRMGHEEAWTEDSVTDRGMSIGTRPAAGGGLVADKRER
jgi:hypothetical protein